MKEYYVLENRKTGKLYGFVEPVRFDTFEEAYDLLVRLYMEEEEDYLYESHNYYQIKKIKEN